VGDKQIRGEQIGWRGETGGKSRRKRKVRRRD